MRHLIIALAALLAAAAQAELSTEDAPSGFVVGLRAYEAADYLRATEVLEAVLIVEPGCARCAHLLGKSYGRLAEQARGLTALGLARKTREALERAVELDPENPQALADLIRYYRTAPGFLGGSDEKARQLEERLQRTSGQSRNGFGRAKLDHLARAQ